MPPTFHLEAACPYPVAGVDEAGCGPWAGPVVAGAAILNATDIPSVLLSFLDDSKKVSPAKRAYLYEILKQEEGVSCWTAYGMATVEEIDTLNIRQAAKLAMTRAVDNLALTPRFLLIDGTHVTSHSISGRAVVKGDQKSYSIAAASIIAKVTRDRLMAELATSYPMYGWETNAGYGTQAHQKALDSHGLTPYHRRSFAPIRKRLTSLGGNV